MNPEVPTQTPITLSTPGSNPVEVISIERVQQIILRRKRSALTASGIVSMVLVATVIFSNHINSLAVIITGMIFILLFVVLYIVSATNYPQPKPYYRQWNKIVYIYLAKVGVIISIFRTADDVKEILNPMHGFKDPTALSRPALLLDATMSAGAGYAAYKSLKPAAYIEKYYKQQDTHST